MKKKALLIVVNSPEFFLSHRLPIVQGAIENGFDVHVATMDGPGVAQIVENGCTHHVISLSRSSRNPLNELRSLFSIVGVMRRVGPELVHLVTIKPVLYGGVAARLLGIHGVISAISGLGFVFIDRADGNIGIVRRLVLAVYRYALGHPNQRIIFQNRTDMEALQHAAGVKPEKSILIRGSGVDLREFKAHPEKTGMPVVIMASRLLKDKGVLEFVEAARELRSKSVFVRFRLVGVPDPGNPETIDDELMEEWQKQGIVECLGFRTDIAQLFSESHIVTLPSYREGLPKVLVEAAASGRAVVTTDVPGCRDSVEPGVSGLLVPARDAIALADALQRLLEDPDLRQSMGKAGRKLAEKEFGIEKIVKSHLEIYRALEVNT